MLQLTTQADVPEKSPAVRQKGFTIDTRIYVSNQFSVFSECKTYNDQCVCVCVSTCGLKVKILLATLCSLCRLESHDLWYMIGFSLAHVCLCSTALKALYSY